MADCHSSKSYSDAPPGVVKKLYDKAFTPGRDPRSGPYKTGILDALRFRAGEGPNPKELLPYPLGTAECDAWFSGLTEGHTRWRNHELKGDDS